MAKFYIDAGHGGSDPGAVGGNWLKESAVNLAVAKHLKAELIRNGHTVKMSRETDVYKTLKQRTDEANEWGADFVVSLHCNSATTTTAQGTETFVYKTSGSAPKLAGCVQLQMVKAFGTKNRYVKEKNLAMVRDTKAPAILCEMAFISNASDRAKLTGEANQKKWAVVICKGICDYLNIKYKGESVVALVKNDNTPDGYAKDAIAWAVSKGILKGDGYGNYMLHKNVTRQDMLVFLYRAMNSK